MKVTIITANGPTTFENDTLENVGALIRELGPSLGVSVQHVAVNGTPATAETPLADGDEITTTKPAGRKGR